MQALPSRLRRQLAACRVKRASIDQLCVSRRRHARQTGRARQDGQLISGSIHYRATHAAAIDAIKPRSMDGAAERYRAVAGTVRV